jgi:hypothetical protein
MTEQVNETPVQLGMADLGAAIQIIDICSKRGAFEGTELESVGALRSRLVAFLQANAPEGAAPEEAVAEETEE